MRKQHRFHRLFRNCSHRPHTPPAGASFLSEVQEFGAFLDNILIYNDYF